VSEPSQSNTSSASATEPKFPWVRLTLTLVAAVLCGTAYWYLFIRERPAPAPKPPTQQSDVVADLVPVQGEKGDTGLPTFGFQPIPEFLGPRIEFDGGFSFSPPYGWSASPEHEWKRPDLDSKDGKLRTIGVFKLDIEGGAIFVRRYDPPTEQGGIQAVISRHEKFLGGETGENLVTRNDFEHGGTIAVGIQSKSSTITWASYFFLTPDGGAFNLDYILDNQRIDATSASMILSSIGSCVFDPTAKRPAPEPPAQEDTTQTDE